MLLLAVQHSYSYLLLAVAKCYMFIINIKLCEESKFYVVAIVKLPYSG